MTSKAETPEQALAKVPQLDIELLTVELNRTAVRLS